MANPDDDFHFHLDPGWGEFRRQLGYKLAWNGGGCRWSIRAIRARTCGARNAVTLHASIGRRKRRFAALGAGTRPTPIPMPRSTSFEGPGRPGSLVEIRRLAGRRSRKPVVRVQSILGLQAGKHVKTLETYAHVMPVRKPRRSSGSPSVCAPCRRLARDRHGRRMATVTALVEEKARQIQLFPMG